MTGRTTAEIASRLTETRIIAVIRAARADQVPPLTEALIVGGVTAVEITMTTANALEAIAEAAGRIGSRGLVGEGTVLDARTCRAAIDAGAAFVVSPILRPEIADAAHDLDRPVMLGAYTPTEAQAAHEAGADFIKIFPADGLGPAYIRALRAPLPHLRIVPTGGVDVRTAPEFLRAGCAALGVGSSLLTAEILRESRWDKLTQGARALREIVDQARARGGAFC